MFSYVAEDVLRSLAVDCSHYESTEEWDKLDNVMELFKVIKKNAAEGMIYLTEEQRDVYLCGESHDYNADCYAT